MAMSRFNRARRSITKAKDFRDDIAILMQPYANWEEYLTPAPLSIALLGQLIRISAVDDFSINKNPPKDGFKFIRYSDSFKACLFQVCNAGWQAFNDAHKNMDQIRLYTGQIPDHIKNVVGIIVQEDTALVQTILPAELENIERISSECLQLAEKTEGKFSEVINLMEALLNAGQCYDVELQEIKKNIEIAKMRKDSAEEAKTLADQACKKLEESVDRAQNEYEKALDSIPSGWELFGMQLLSSVSELAMTVAVGYAITQFLGPIGGYIFSGVGAIPVITGGIWDIIKATKEGSTTSHTSPANQMQVKEVMSAYNVFARSGQILLLSAKMNDFYNGNKLNWTELYDQKNETLKSDFVKKMFAKTKQDIITEEESRFKTEALNICEKGISICTELAKCAPSKECDDATTMKLIEDITSLNNAAQVFDSKSKFYTNCPPLSVEPPHSTKQQTSDSPDSLHVNLARLRVEQSEVMLNKVTEMHDKAFKNMEKKRIELLDIVMELQRLQPKEIDFEKRIIALAKGLEAMGQVKEQWEKLVHFFQLITNTFKTILTHHLNSFTQTVELAVKHSYTFDKFIKDKIYTNTLNASAYAYLVNMISTTYTEVSGEYLMDSVSTLGKLMAMDPNSIAFHSEMAKFEVNCTKAEESIRGIAAKNKKEIELRCQDRILQIQTVLKPALPPISEEANEKLKKIIQEAMKALPQEEKETKPVVMTELMSKEETDQFV
ncbi:uncharacterized protein LOC119263693 [Pygocentrus nattereri]|uniref:Uncharacterized protein n=1 Tax=Pygocentrus nattereri TaxID=42514 RepID=A0AAR2K9H4_PYGNA|nr:uncharacterized protein LOC119263693 [Pygocentrus nattereri]